MNFVCTVFEQGDEMLTLLSVEKNNGRMQPKIGMCTRMPSHVAVA